MAKIFGLIGKNIGYSFSRKYFSEKFNQEKLPFQYDNFDIPNIDNVPQLLTIKNISGFNVTIPYKEAIIPYLDQIDPIAKAIGAVNVVKITKEGKTRGYNSDHYGFLNSLTPHLHPGNTLSAIILGTGGASKAVKYALDTLTISYTVVSRNPSKNQLSYNDIDEETLQRHKLLINTTPLGTSPNIQAAPNLPYAHLTANHILYDLIYNPERTTFLKHGIQKGATVINGKKMLILQAEKSWEIWNS
ncbi:shikimate dehydrogenase family protein [Aquimarina intermedia]|uniref:Shikimate dehydrogenase n=1 Tax=Aquimarina intermedia TaxID=350814 RepID=A0A5S5BTG9_9FLAO|nr:shikimate dehydrogenase [Aquimarina intermedia]TYP70475.1 shikimate dehydrogenase [Aquimarina intermedia]